MHLLLATSNKGKAHEMREALNGCELTLLDLRDVPVIGAPEETGMTFEENAKQKALHYFQATDYPTIADDSGIHVDALEGELGVHTRRWGAGPDASDKEWVDYFLKRMSREKNKRAQFVCVIAHTDQNGETHFFRGACDGVVTDTVEADYLPGLPISGCFKPDGFDHVFSALSIEQKNSTSHRGRALIELRDFLLKRK